MIRQQMIEEILEHVWTARESGSADASAILAGTPGAPTIEDLDALVALGHLRRANGHVELTPGGERIGRTIVRRNRLAERLLQDVLAVDDAQVESQACEFEHILSPEVTDSVCAFLGHPPTCPHGKLIPPGDCCAVYARELRPLVQSLTELELGGAGRIVFVAPKHHGRMDKLATLGVVPGSTLRLRQRHPSYVIDLGESTIALDPEIAADIYVKRI